MTSVDTVGIIVEERRQYRDDKSYVVPLPAAFTPVVETIDVTKEARKTPIKSENIDVVRKPKSTSIPTTEHPHRPSPPSSAPVFDVVTNKTVAAGGGAKRKHVVHDKGGSTLNPVHPHGPTKQSVFEVVDHSKRRSPKDYPPIASHTTTPRSTGLLFYPVPGDSSSDSRRTVQSASSVSQLKNGPIHQQTQPRSAKSEQTIPSHRPVQPLQPTQQKSPRSYIAPTAATSRPVTTAQIDRFAIPSVMSEDQVTSAATKSATQTPGPSNGKSAGSRLLIKGGQIINDDSILTGDVFIEDGIIKQVGPNLTVPGGARIIDAKGKYVMPGGIDPHTHLQMPFFGTTTADDFYSGTKAAVAGGTTMIVDFVATKKGESLVSAYDKYRGMADPKVCCDYGLSIIVSYMSDKVKEEMSDLVKNKGVNAFKFFTAYKDVFMIRDDEMYQGFLQCKKIGALARVHAENGDIIAAKEKEILSHGVTGPEGHLQSRPEEVEAEATNRACVLANQANCPLYVVHVMSKGAAEAIGNARRKGAIVFGEAIAAALATDGNHYFDKCWRHAAAHVLSPPLRTDSTTADYLMDMLSGGQLHLTGSDHAVFNSTQKALGKDDFTKIPNGVNGLEERMMLIWQKGVNMGKMDPMRFVAVTSSTAAKLFNVYPKKGRIAEGSDADVVVWDPEGTHTISSKTHHSNIDFNIYEGETCHGIPWMTIAGGRVVFEDGQVKVAQGAGKFVALPPYSPHVYSSILQREKVRVPIKVDRDAAAATRTPVTPVQTGAGEPVQHAPAPPVTPVSVHTSPFDEIPVGAKAGGDFHTRQPTRAGGRNLQDSSFALSGVQIDDDQATRRSTKISKPPGGESRGLW